MTNEPTPQEVISNFATLRSQGKMTWKDQFTCGNEISHEVALPLIDAVLNRTGKEKDQLGKDMESLVHYLLTHCGFFCNVENNYENAIHQLDHWAEVSPLIVDYLKAKDIHLINYVGESKNYSDKLNVDKIYKLESIKGFTKSQLGSFFTTFGLKGDFDRSAKALLSFYYHKQNHITLIFTEEDWKFLRNDTTKFSALFYEKLAKFQATYDSEKIDYDKI